MFRVRVGGIIFQLSMLNDVSGMAILVEHSFFDPYAGDSRDGSPAAKFSTGDIILVNAAEPRANHGTDNDEVAHACLAVFQSQSLKMDGVSSGVCLKCHSRPRAASLHFWKSLQHCYSWILTSDHRKAMLPYLERFRLDIKYDIFRVVYVSSDSATGYGQYVTHQHHHKLEHGGESNERQVLHKREDAPSYA